MSDGQTSCHGIVRDTRCAVKIAILSSDSGRIACCERYDCQLQYTAATNRGKSITLVVGKRRRLFFTGDDDEVFMTRSLSVTPNTTEQHI